MADASLAAEPLITVREAARQIGVNQSTLSRQIKAGAIRSHGGKVRLSELLEDRAQNIDLTRSHRRSARNASLEAASPKADTSDVVFVDGQPIPFAQAQALKETYLARLRQLEFEAKSGALIDKEMAKQTFFDVAREQRDAWHGWPSRVAVLMAAELGVEPPTLVEVLSRYVHQHLAELGEPQPGFGGG